MSAMLQDLIHSLYEIVDEAKSLPLSSDKCIVDRERLLSLLSDALRCMPEDLDMARDIVEKKNQILSDAKKHSESIIENAHKQAQALIAHEEIVLNAEAKARDIIYNAQTKYAEVKKVSTDFCEETLMRAENGLASVLEEIKNTRKRFKGQ